MEVILDSESSRDFGLILEHKPTIPIAKQRVNNIQIEGRNGSLTEKLGYENKTIEVKFILLEDDNLNRQIRHIVGWLLNAKTLKFSDDLDIYYKIKYIDISSIDRQLRILGSFSVSFVVDPFSYLEDEIVTIDKAIAIFNPGTYYSEPYLKIYGNGDINISLNDTVLTLNGIQDYIEIDTELMQCRKDSINSNNKMIGDFPILQVGENNISWTGKVNRIEIKPRLRYL